MKPDGVWSHAWGNGGRWLLVFSAVFFLAVGVLIAVAARVVFDDRYLSEVVPFNPIRYSKQAVNTPVVRNGDPIEVEGDRCNSADEPVVVRGRTTWTLYTPSGQQFSGPIGGVLRDPGCVHLKATVAIPPEVVAINERLFAAGLQQAQWRLEGSGTPVTPSGELGIPAFWKSSIFTVLP